MSTDLALTLLASIPSPDRGVWHLGPVPIRAYALCIIVGIVVAIWWGERRYVARGGQPGTVVDVAVFAVPLGLIGGRLYHVLTDWSTYFGEGEKTPIDALKIWQGGLGIWGAIALGGVGAWIGCRRRGVPLPFLADAVAPGIAVAQAIGRLGNWFNQELWGRSTTLPWGLEIYERVHERVNPATGVREVVRDPLTGVAIDKTPLLVVHPTFLYEMLWCLGVAALVVWADRRFTLGHGRAFALYVAAYCAGRLWIELLRADEATEVFGVRINVITSVVVFAGAIVYMLVAPRGRETLAPVVVANGAAEGDAASELAGADAQAATSTDPDAAAEPADTEAKPADTEAKPADTEAKPVESAEATQAAPAAEAEERTDAAADSERAGTEEGPGTEVRSTTEERSATEEGSGTADRADAPVGAQARADSGSGADEGRPASRPAQGS